jgi:LEA14-like dessication related protein
MHSVVPSRQDLHRSTIVDLEWMFVYDAFMFLRGAKIAGLISVVTVAGCASWFMKGEPPDVLVTNVTPLESSAFEQRLQVDLRIRNPNDFDLHVTGIDFKLDLNGKRLARGLSNKELTVPRLSDAVLTVQTSASTFDIVRQVLAVSQKQELSYDISGVLHTQDGRLPFESTGVLFEKGEFSGSLPP